MTQTIFNPPVETYLPLATLTTSGGEASITFSSIPLIYKDLVLTISGTASSPTNMSIGGTSGRYIEMRGVGSGTPVTARDTGRTYAAGFTSSTIASNIIHIMDYAETTKFKTIVAREGDTSNRTSLRVVSWDTLSAVSSITLTLEGAITFNANCVASLYGIEG